MGSRLHERAAVTAAAVVVVSVLSAAIPAVASMVDDGGIVRHDSIDVLQYNVHQGRDGDVVGQLTAQVEDDRPDVVSLSELCRYDYDRLAADLEQLGYSAAFTVSHRSSLGCRAFEKGWDQGVAVFVAGRAVDGRAESYRIGQGVACLTSDSLPRIRACAVHLTSPQDASPPGEATVGHQVDVLREKLMSKPDLPLVVAGDFNLPPWNPSMQRMYGDFYDVAMNDGACAPWPTAAVPDDARLYGGRCTYDHSWQGGKKIDYAFVDKRHFDSVDGASVEAIHGLGCHGDYLGYGDACSDHRPLRGSASVHVSDLTLQASGMRLWTGETPVDTVRFGESRRSGEIVNGLERMMGPSAYTVDAAGVDGACAGDVDRYVAWGIGAAPTFALALRQTGDAGTDAVVVGYRLYDDIERVAVDGDVGAEAGHWGVPVGWAGEQCGLGALPDADLAAAAGGDVREQSMYLQQDVNAAGHSAWS